MKLAFNREGSLLRGEVKHWPLRLALATTVGLATVGGAAYATGFLRAGSGSTAIQACQNKTTGELRIVADNHTGCRAHELPLTWNMQGQKGETGAQGTAGANGRDGAAGAQGLKGDPGPAGPAGTNGQDGAPGKDGTPGPTGPAGVPGATGAAGSTGATGPAGPAGLAAPAFLVGSSGGASVNFGDFIGVGGASPNDDLVAQVMSVSGTLSDLFVHISPVPTQNAGFTIVISGLPTNANSLVCTVPNGAASCSDTTHTESFSAGDRISLYYIISGAAPFPTPAVTWSVRTN